ncbi:helix-turn-helix domain-containing protein [Infirmifilum lucidum]|uniref:Helix-turn-helix domain-containing protein n=1 Tax=Infirmifilum lucidum TaxID=2776706 RepID=A0A7L9FJS6_9CREN|nr:helix-turn-helix domain-containing protein [Infirmifilum lucidum]QOJ79184.1 helix-turn-helix domain-containing protein [Infirmifilum lucidum]
MREASTRLLAYKVVMKPYKSVLSNLSRIAGANVYIEGIIMNSDKATTLVHVSLPPRKEKTHQLIIEMLQKYPEVIDYRILSKRRHSLTLAVTKNLCEFYEYTLGSSRFTFFPYVIKSGNREFYILSPEDKKLLLSNLSKYGQVLLLEKLPHEMVIKETCLTGLRIAVDNIMTSYQRLILAEALKRGYYDWPRRTSLSELARLLSISKTTLSEHLRKGERKLIELLLGSIQQGSYLCIS